MPRAWLPLRRCARAQVSIFPLRAVPGRQHKGIRPTEVEPSPTAGSSIPLGVYVSLFALALAVAGAVAVVQTVKGTVTHNPGRTGTLAFNPFTSSYLVLLRAVGTASILAGGVIGLFDGGLRCLGSLSRLSLSIYGLGSCVWIMIGLGAMGPKPLLSADNSPLIWLLCFGLFIGARPEALRYVLRMAGFAAWFLAPLMLYSIISIRHYGRFEGFNPQVAYLSLAVWFAACHLLAAPGSRSYLAAVRSIPLLACGLLAVFTQGRGWLIQCALAFLLLAARPLFLRESRALSKVVRSLAVAAIMLAVLGFLVLRFYPLAVEGFASRLTVDSRSEQYGEFFSQVDPLDIISGKGPEATYRRSDNRLNYEYFDNQFLWMDFKGGLVIVLGYTILVLAPGLRLLFRARNESEYAAAGTLVLWTLGLAGLSTYNNIYFSAQNYLVVVLAGCCHSCLASRRGGATEMPTWRALAGYNDLAQGRSREAFSSSRKPFASSI